MFTNVCTSCGKRELIFADQIRSLKQTDHGFDVRYACWCGATQTWHVAREGEYRVAAAA
jgi:hypothetical protein